MIVKVSLRLGEESTTVVFAVCETMIRENVFSISSIKVKSFVPAAPRTSSRERDLVRTP